MDKRVITTSDATIKQVSVEIKVIKIDKKQMTLAVFKQLQSEPIINPYTGGLQGEAWGRVNYHVGCDGIDEHFHVVWQEGSELRRGIAFLPWKKMDSSQLFPYSFYDSARRKLHEHYFRYLAAKTAKGWVPHNPYWAVGDQIDWTIVSTRLLDTFCCEALTRAWHSLNSQSLSNALRSQAFADLRYRLEKETGESLEELDEDAIYADMIEIAQAFKPIMTNWKQSYIQLEQLNQLFIAV